METPGTSSANAYPADTTAMLVKLHRDPSQIQLAALHRYYWVYAEPNPVSHEVPGRYWSKILRRSVY